MTKNYKNKGGGNNKDCFAPARFIDWVSRNALTSTRQRKPRWLMRATVCSRAIGLQSEMIAQSVCHIAQEGEKVHSEAEKAETERMADTSDLVLVAVDECDHSERAFECEQK